MLFGKPKENKEAKATAQAIKAERIKQDELSRPIEYKGFWLNPVTIAKEYANCIIAGSFRSFIPNLNILALKDEASLSFVKTQGEEPNHLLSFEGVPFIPRHTVVEVNDMKVVMLGDVFGWAVVGNMQLDDIDSSAVKNGVIYNNNLVDYINLILKRDL